MTIKLSDDVSLVERRNTSYLQALIKTPDGAWRRYSTKTSDVQKATEFAFAKKAELQFRVQHDIPIVDDHSFKQVAESYIEDLQERVKEGTASLSEQSYISKIRNNMIPFFGQKSIRKLADEVEPFFDHLESQYKDGMPKPTLNVNMIALRAVFKHAVRNKWCTEVEQPNMSIKGRGKKSDRRGHFTPDEFNKMMAEFPKWIKEAVNEKQKHRRTMLWLYVHFLVTTGVRTGEEALNIRLDDIEFVRTAEGRRNYYSIYIRFGKTAGKTADGKPKKAVRNVLISEETYEWLLGVTSPIYHAICAQNELTEHPAYQISTDVYKDVKTNPCLFQDVDGSQLLNRDVTRMFNQFLKRTKMKFDNAGLERSLYSCRHTFATWKLQRGVTFEQLRDVMGTSIEMLEKHYSHVKPDDFAEQLIM